MSKTKSNKGKIELAPGSLTLTIPSVPSRPVIVMTEYRGVFFGHSSDPLHATTATLTGLRNAIYWSKSVGGVFGLAEKGPDANCRIGAKVSGPIGLQKVTAIVECTPEAAKAWDAAPAVS